MLFNVSRLNMVTEYDINLPEDENSKDDAQEEVSSENEGRHPSRDDRNEGMK